MKTSRLRLDVLRWKPIRVLVASPAFPVVPQAIVLGAVVLVALNGIGLGLDMSAGQLMTFRKTNLTTLLVWGLWWPSMIALALGFGRAWCTVCPMELVNRIGDAIARKVGWPRARLGRVLRAGWAMVAFYLTLHLLVAGVSLHRVPHETAILLGVLFAGALLTGMIFRDPRSFCRSFCPAGPLLSVYGRTTPWQLEAHDASVCEQCSTKDCVSEANRYRFDKRSCPSLLRPFQRAPSDGCVLCMQCVKVCPHDNMGVGIVSPDAPVRRKTLLEPYEAAFVMVALGFVAHETIGEVKWLDGVFHFVPNHLGPLLSGVPFGWLEASWFLVLFPALVWGAIAALALLFGHRAGPRPLLLAAATGAAPVVAVAHFAKAAAKLSSWGGYLPGALADPRGVETFNRIANHTLSKPEPLVGLSILGWVMGALTLLIAWRSLRWLRDMPPESILAARAGAACTLSLFVAILGVWTWSAG